MARQLNCWTDWEQAAGIVPSTFHVRKSLGLIWVTELTPDPVEHGPFMDLADAYDQCDRPTEWHVEFGA